MKVISSGLFVVVVFVVVTCYCRLCVFFKTLLLLLLHTFSTRPLSFYRPDALPVAQPTASKHWRHIFLCQITGSSVPDPIPASVSVSSHIVFLCQVTGSFVPDPIPTAVQASSSVHPGWSRCSSRPFSYAEHWTDAQDTFPTLTGTCFTQCSVPLDSWRALKILTFNSCKLKAFNTHTRLMALVRDYPGEVVPER